jgi:hypothetical protein
VVQGAFPLHLFTVHNKGLLPITPQKPFTIIYAYDWGRKNLKLLLFAEANNLNIAPIVDKLFCYNYSCQLNIILQ